MEARARASKNARKGDAGSCPASGDLCDTETREPGELFLALAENCPSMVFITQHGTVKYANPRCEKIMGYTREEMYADGFRQDEGIKSMVCVPFAYGETELGFLGFSSIHEEREWPEGIISVLRLVGEVFTGALKRRNVLA